ncbi:MAG: hypothetical protein HRJ53_18400 [Acidobacteria bacterium Pan2503]|uniref:Uncharacterized protein n=1 Tax=Candidatus Acidiferrum panamense TaxID=2741543 RepID=A0A7V8SYQ3_9BACT|nr:hypothetical protein [Candidatus Acidoferrum panamensis]
MACTVVNESLTHQFSAGLRFPFYDEPRLDLHGKEVAVTGGSTGLDARVLGNSLRHKTAHCVIGGQASPTASTMGSSAGEPAPQR